MISTSRPTILAISICAALVVSACQPTASSVETIDTTAAEEVTSATSVVEATTGSDTEAYTDNNISASDMVADQAPMTDMRRDYSKSLTRMYDEMQIGMGYNDPDTTFAKAMLGHRRGALDLATIELKHGTDANMRQLAQQVHDEQQAEIAIINKWLASHLDATKPKLETPFVQQAYAESAEQMYDEMMLGIADPSADLAFARSLLPHYVGAVDMAMIELKYGTDEDMLALARAIIAQQPPRLELLQDWITTHPSREQSNDDSLATAESAAVADTVNKPNMTKPPA